MVFCIFFFFGLVTCNLLEISSLTDWDAVPTSTPSLILYHMDWCGHCRKFLPEFESAAKDLETPLLISVHCSASESLCEKIESFPTLSWFDKGLKFPGLPVKGVRDHAGLLSWISRMQGGDFSGILKSRKELDAMVSEKGALVLVEDGESHASVIDMSRELKLWGFDTYSWEGERTGISSVSVWTKSAVGNLSFEVARLQVPSDLLSARVRSLLCRGPTRLPEDEKFFQFLERCSNPDGPGNLSPPLTVLIAASGVNSEMEPDTVTIIEEISSCLQSRPDLEVVVGVIDGDRWMGPLGDFGISRLPGVVVVRGEDWSVFWLITGGKSEPSYRLESDLCKVVSEIEEGKIAPSSQSVWGTRVFVVLGSAGIFIFFRYLCFENKLFKKQNLIKSD